MGEKGSAALMQGWMQTIEGGGKLSHFFECQRAVCGNGGYQDTYNLRCEADKPRCKVCREIVVRDDLDGVAMRTAGIDDSSTLALDPRLAVLAKESRKHPHLLHGYEVFKPASDFDGVYSFDDGMIRRGYEPPRDDDGYWGFLGLCITCESDERPF